jgi:hypothetical protein
MTTPTFGQPGYTPEQLAAVQAAVQPPPVGTGPSPADMAAKLSGAMPFEVDVEAMIKAAVAAEVKRIMAQSSAGEGEHPVIGATIAAQGLIGQHFEFHRRRDELTRLADDNVDAARNAVESGDAGPLRQVNARLERALLRWHPGPGDNHYFTQALAHVQVHIPDAADTITEPTPSSAPAVGSSQAPAKVLQGSVTG